MKLVQKDVWQLQFWHNGLLETAIFDHEATALGYATACMVEEFKQELHLRIVDTRHTNVGPADPTRTYDVLRAPFRHFDRLTAIWIKPVKYYERSGDD